MTDPEPRRRARRASRGWWGDTAIIGLIGTVGGVAAGETALAVASLTLSVISGLVWIRLRRGRESRASDDV